MELGVQVGELKTTSTLRDALEIAMRLTGTSIVRALFCTVFPFGLLWAIVSGANRSVQDVVLRTNVIYDWVISIPGFRKTGAAQASIVSET